MKIGQMIDITNFFHKVDDNSDVIQEGVTQLFYPDTDKLKVLDLPVAPNAYLEIEKVAVAPDPVGAEGQMYYNTTDEKFYASDGAVWVECLFGVTPVGA